MLGSRKFYLSLLSVVACLAATTDTIFSVLDASSLSSAEVSFVALPVAASAFDVISLCCVVLFSTQYAWKREGIVNRSTGARRLLAGSCIILSVVALVISLASLVTIRRRLGEVTSARSRTLITNWNGYLAGHFTVWTMACLSQLALFSMPLWRESSNLALRSIPYPGARDSVMSEVRTSNQTATQYMLKSTQLSSPPATIYSPTASERSSRSLKSWRNSLHQVVRPATSRTKLITRPSLSRDGPSVYPGDPSLENVSQPDGFDTWDTSDVSLPTKDVASPSAPSRGTALEPIPGSRPASPARALDGPFPLESGEIAPVLTRPRLLPDTSRPPSPAVSEAHIHPLFRSESPVPPPVVTPGTNVLASPLANHMIACPPRPYSRMRSSSSRTVSPTLAQSQSFRERAMSMERDSRSPSPPSRELTPPIPDFVLNSSPRRSRSGTTKTQRDKLSSGASP